MPFLTADFCLKRTFVTPTALEAAANAQCVSTEERDVQNLANQRPSTDNLFEEQAETPMHLCLSGGPSVHLTLLQQGLQGWTSNWPETCLH